MKKMEKMEKMRKYEEDENVDDDIYPVMKCFQVIKERSYLVRKAILQAQAWIMFSNVTLCQGLRCKTYVGSISKAM